MISLHNVLKRMKSFILKIIFLKKVCLKWYSDKNIYTRKFLNIIYVNV